jgi:DNA modification methylase
VTNTLFTNDNLFILHGLNSESADLIYLDPPFNSKRMYSAPVGTKAAGAAFKDMWTWEDVNTAYLETLVSRFPKLAKLILSAQEVHSKAMASYLAYMAQRLIECHRILKSSGSLYLHCDPTASHYLKGLLDAVFGRDNFRNEISWKRTNAKGLAFTRFASNHDVILAYGKDSSKTRWNAQYTAHGAKYLADFYKYTDEDGRRYQLADLVNPNKDRPNLTYTFMGVSRVWRWTKERMQAAYDQGLIVQTAPGNVPRLKRYLDEQEGNPIGDFWDDIRPASGKERTGYPTQKPLALLHRIIAASSNEGDMVLDPFCGCATTCVAAQQLGRNWIGIDIESQASKILIERLSDDAGMFSNFIHRTDIPQRSDIVETPITLSVKESLFANQQGICNGCAIGFGMKNLEIDHIIPRAKGGGDYYENYQLLCASCNRIKGDRPMEYLMNRLNVIEAAHRKISFGE